MRQRRKGTGNQIRSPCFLKIAGVAYAGVILSRPVNRQDPQGTRSHRTGTIIAAVRPCVLAYQYFAVVPAFRLGYDTG
jgi:hypothetical protein